MKITNTGEKEGKEVVQLYTSTTDEPNKLEAMAKTSLIRPGQSETVHLYLDHRAFARWVEDSWKVRSGVWRLSLCTDAVSEVLGFDLTV